MTFFFALKDQRFVIKVLQPFERILFVPFFLIYDILRSTVKWPFLSHCRRTRDLFLWDLEAMKWFLSLPLLHVCSCHQDCLTNGSQLVLQPSYCFYNASQWRHRMSDSCDGDGAGVLWEVAVLVFYFFTAVLIKICSCTAVFKCLSEWCLLQEINLSLAGFDPSLA